MKFAVRSWLKRRSHNAKLNSRIYIIPTRWGVLFFLNAFLIIGIGAIYANNVVNLMGYMLLALVLLGAALTNQTLKSVNLQSVHVTSNFVGHPIFIELLIKNFSSEDKSGLHFEIHRKEGAQVQLELAPLELRGASISMKLDKRGNYRLENLKVWTQSPFGLFYSWKIFAVNLPYDVYPDPRGQRPLPEAGGELQVERGQKPEPLPEDFYQLRPWIEGEGLSRIDWKAYARGRPLLVKEFAKFPGRSIRISWKDHRFSNLEEKLSQFSKWIDLSRNLNIAVNFEDESGEIRTIKSRPDYDHALSYLARFPGEGNI